MDDYLFVISKRGCTAAFVMPSPAAINNVKVNQVLAFERMRNPFGQFHR
jgi:hypothetical protein